MLKTVRRSSNKKLGNCAATYRAGLGSVFSTCPSQCPLKPASEVGATQVDQEYLEALINAVPRNGVSWTYTPFKPEDLPRPIAGKTAINISTDTVDDAVDSFRKGHPTVVVRPAAESNKVDTYEGVRAVRCPAEYSNITCDRCGSGVPLCARQDRNYIIKFTAHGAQSKTIQIRNSSDIDAKGGCYGTSGPVRLQWSKAIGDTESDAKSLTSFVKTLPPGSLIRHHVVGDIGE